MTVDNNNKHDRPQKPLLIIKQPFVLRTNVADMIQTVKGEIGFTNVLVCSHTAPHTNADGHGRDADLKGGWKIILPEKREQEREIFRTKNFFL